MGTDESSEDKFCPNCGCSLPRGAKFCEQCGAKVIEDYAHKSDHAAQNLTGSLSFNAYVSSRLISSIPSQRQDEGSKPGTRTVGSKDGMDAANMTLATCICVGLKHPKAASSLTQLSAAELATINEGMTEALKRTRGVSRLGIIRALGVNSQGWDAQKMKSFLAAGFPESAIIGFASMCGMLGLALGANDEAEARAMFSDICRTSKKPDRAAWYEEFSELMLREYQEEFRVELA